MGDSENTKCRAFSSNFVCSCCNNECVGVSTEASLRYSTTFCSVVAPTLFEDLLLYHNKKTHTLLHAPVFTKQRWATLLPEQRNHREREDWRGSRSNAVNPMNCPPRILLHDRHRIRLLVRAPIPLLVPQSARSLSPTPGEFVRSLLYRT